MATFTSLPVEIQQEIIDLVYESAPKSEYACVSRQWQALCESKNFATVDLNQTCLEDARRILNPARRSLVREIHMHVLLPEYDATKSVDKRYRESAEDQQRNNKVFTSAVRDLFHLLHSWQFQGEEEEAIPSYRRNISLSISVSSPSDFPVINNSSQTRFREQLRKRWQSSYLELDSDELGVCPAVTMVSAFSWPNTGPEYRRIAPSACCRIASYLPYVQSLNWHLSDDERKNVGLRRRLREEFASEMQRSLPQTVRHFKLAYRGGNPSNHDWRPPRLYSRDEAAIDPLSVALRHLAQRLISLELNAPTTLTSEIFWPETPSSDPDVNAAVADLQFPILEQLKICMAPVSAAGSWLFDAHPALGGRPESPDAEYGNAMVFDREEKTPGEEFTNLYRCLIDSDVAEQYMLAAARATANMPRISSLELTLSSPLPVYVNYHNISAEYDATRRPSLSIKGCFPPEPSRDVKEAWQEAAASRLVGSRGRGFPLAINLITTFDDVDACLGHGSNSRHIEQEPEIIDIS